MRPPVSTLKRCWRFTPRATASSQMPGNRVFPRLTTALGCLLGTRCMRTSNPTEDDKVSTELTSSEKIVHTRKALALTQKAFASLLGIDRSYLSQLEQGKRPVRTWIIDKCVNLLMEKGPVSREAVPSVLKSVGLLTGRSVTSDGSKTTLHAAEAPSDVLTKASEIIAKAPTEDLFLAFEVLVSARAKAPATVDQLFSALVSLLRIELNSRAGAER